MANKIVKVVAHPTTGLVVTPSTKNPLWGTFRVDSENVSMENGIMNRSKRSAFIRGQLLDLNSLGLKADQALPGKIIKRESFEPFYVGQPAKLNPTTMQVVLTNGRETYIEFAYTEDVNAPDVWVGDTTAQVADAVAGAIAGQTV